ncbi:MAG: carbohydrate ABC transporter permease [Kiloniellaceae bacterium]
MTARPVRRIGFALAVLAILAFTLAPVYWAVVTSLETGSALFTVDYLPAAPSRENYVAVFAEQPFGRNILNSVMVAVGTVALALGAAVLAAYALAQIEFGGRIVLLYVILGVSMFPQVAVLSGLFEVLSALGLYNDWFGLTIAYMIFTLPFTTWVLTTFMRQLPAEIEEAALIDGATHWRVVMDIFVPLLRPALVTSGLLAFIAAWNEFLFALTFTLTNDARTVPVAIALISGASQYELPWGRIMAASVIVTVPVVILALVFQRRIVSGLTAGALSG